MQGDGTRSCPIEIDLDDSEEEICYELIPHTPYSGSDVRLSPLPLRKQVSGEPGPSRLANVEEPRSRKKRERTSESDEEHEGRPNKMARTLEDRLSNGPAAPPKVSKSAKKRQNKAEKRARIQALNRQRLTSHAPGLEPVYPPGVSPEDNPNLFSLLPCNQPPYDRIPPYFPGNQYNNAPPANWAQSAPWPTTPAITTAFPVLLPYTPPEPDFPPPSLPPLPTHNAPGPKAELHRLPAKPPPPVNIPIGMQPDQDPNSKHGIFKIENLVSEDKPYMPNPALTLVMEQLPKSHRNPEFINAWGRKVTGASPVKIFIDSSAAKALVEFATSELARKAWESPRLGANYAGLKSHQLKGKPREDLIRVWWYRVNGVGARSGVGEIEEGEIEGDAQEAEASQAKETKKARKFRLDQERREKAAREHAVLQAPQPSMFGTAQARELPPLKVPYLDWGRQVQSPAVSHPVMPNSPGKEIDVDMKLDGEDMDLASPVQNSPIVNSIPPPNDISPTTDAHVAKDIVAPIALARSLSTLEIQQSLASTKAEESKKAIAARQRELEEQIARSRSELEQLQALSSVQQQTPSLSPSPTPTPPVIPAPEQTMEALLRERVLQTKKDRQLKTAAAAPPVPTVTVSNFTVDAKPESTSGVSFSLMADSFISQVLKDAKLQAPQQQHQQSKPPTPRPLPPPPRTTSTAKAELEKEAKRERLERLDLCIAQYKPLMEQLERAKTKQEKDVIRAKLKELDAARLAEEAMTTDGPPANTPTVASKAPRIPTEPAPAVRQSIWPQYEPESSVFDLSDDEDDD